MARKDSSDAAGETVSPALARRRRQGRHPWGIPYCATFAAALRFRAPSGAITGPTIIVSSARRLTQALSEYSEQLDLLWLT